MGVRTARWGRFGRTLPPKHCGYYRSTVSGRRRAEGAAWHPLRAQHPDPEGVPRVPVTDIVRSLQLFLDELGCLVREVADGWALLRSGPFALLLIHEPTPTDPARLQPSSDPPTAEVRPHRRPAGVLARSRR